MFPEAKIITLDLKDSDPLFIKTYKRDDKTYRMRFIDMRNSILNSCHNVQFIQENSVNYLYFETQKYDLIWVDGAHGYPVVSIDILNSLKLLDKNGYLICDDIFQQVDKSDPLYRSIASMETLVSFLNAKVISKVSLIIKRFISKQKKFIAVIEEKNINKSKNEENKS